MRENRWQSSRPIPFGIRFYIAIWIDVFKFQNLVKFNLLNWDRLAGLLISHFQNFQPTFSILYLSCCWEKLGFITEFRGRMATISVSRMKFHSPISDLGNLRTNQPLRQNERSETHSVSLGSKNTVTINEVKWDYDSQIFPWLFQVIPAQPRLHQSIMPHQI